MMGTVRFSTHRGESAEAYLDESGRWHCPRVPVLVRVLDALYDPRRAESEFDEPERAQLLAAARWLKGSVEPAETADAC